MYTVDELGDGRKTGFDSDGNRTRAMTFQVWSDDTGFTDDDARAVIPVTQRVTRHPQDGNCLADHCDVEPVSGTVGLFHCVYTFTSAPLNAGSDSTGSDPTEQDAGTAPEARPWTISCEVLAVEVPCVKDVTGAAMVAANGQAFTGLTYTRYDKVYKIEGYLLVSTTDLVAQDKFTGKINLNAWMGFPAKCLLCRGINFNRTFTYNDRYFKFDASFQYKMETDAANAFVTWVPDKILNQGSYILGPTGEPPLPVVDAEGNPTKDLMPLNASGRQLTTAQILAGSFTYIDCYKYRTADFATILT